MSVDAWRRAAAASICGILVAGAGLAFFRAQDLRHREALLLAEGSHVVALERAFLSRELRAVHSDLLFLAQQPLLQRVLAGDVRARAELAREYSGFAESKPLYGQIRLLDETGMEVVRVNRRGDEVGIVEEGELQSKSNRYYFREGIRLEAGDVFVSPLDLNVERGEIERPPNPVIRLATPVEGPGVERRGLLVLNYAGARLLGLLREISRASRGEILLLDRDGEYLLSPEPSREWGWLLGHADSFRGDHPEAWERIREPERSQIRIADDLFTAQWVPLAEGAGNSRSAVAIVSRISLGEEAALALGPGRLILLSAMLLLIVALSIYWARASDARRMQERRIAESEGRLRTLSSRLLAAQEEERRSLSRLLHDELGQQVTAILLDLKAALRHAGDGGPALRRVVAETEAVLSSLHEIAGRVRPSVLDDLGLQDAIDSHLCDYEERTGVSISADLRLPKEALSVPEAENVYRIIQEALSNIAAHAETDAGRIALVTRRDAIDLLIEDEGRGFDAATLKGSSRLGILGMRERAELLGGEFTLETAPGQGTRIHVRLPRCDVQGEGGRGRNG